MRERRGFWLRLGDNMANDDFWQWKGDADNGAGYVSIVGSLANQVVLQTNATTAVNGNAYTALTDVTLTFVITGTSISRTVVFELADPIVGVFQNLALPTKMGDTTYAPQLSTTGGSNTLPELWQVDIPVGFTFRTRISVAPVGGDIDISGNSKVVIG